VKPYLLMIVLITGLLAPGWLGAQEEPAPSYQDETSIMIQDTEPETDTGTGGGATLTFWDIFRMILILAAVVLVIYLIFHFLKKAGGPRFRENDLITMHASLGLGGSRSLHLVEVGREMFLVGAGDNSVNLISKLEDKDSLDEIRFRLSTEKEGQENRSFAGIISRMFQREKPEMDLSGTLSRNRDFLKGQRDRLKKL